MGDRGHDRTWLNEVSMDKISWMTLFYPKGDTYHYHGDLITKFS